MRPIYKPPPCSLLPLASIHPSRFPLSSSLCSLPNSITTPPFIFLSQIFSFVMTHLPLSLDISAREMGAEFECWILSMLLSYCAWKEQSLVMVAFVSESVGVNVKKEISMGFYITLLPVMLFVSLYHQTMWHWNHLVEFHNLLPFGFSTCFHWLY